MRMKIPEGKANFNYEAKADSIVNGQLDSVCCMNSDSGTMTIHYTYSGEKFMVEMIHNSEKKDVPELQTRLYLGGLEFEHDKYGGNWSEFEPKAYYFGDGRYLYHEDRYQYYLTDHLGNTVVIFEDKDGDGEITQTGNPITNEVIDRYLYYAFGLRWEMPEPYEIDYDDENHYRYNSKEWDRISEWYDYGWRWYDPVIGRWNAVDPLAELGPQFSPYMYSFNNPVYYIDPDGRWPFPFVRSDGKFGSFRDQIQFNRAMVSSFVKNASATANFLLNPIGTAEGLAGLARGAGILVNDFDGTMAMIGEAASGFASDLLSDDPTVRGEAMGSLAFLAIDAVVGAKGASKLAKGKNISQGAGGTNLFGKEVTTTTPRVGRDGKAVEVTFKDGSKIDINRTRVKEWVPNTHPNAPAGTLQKVKFDDSLPGSKGYKRKPTQSELDFLDNL